MNPAPVNYDVYIHIYRRIYISPNIWYMLFAFKVEQPKRRRSARAASHPHLHPQPHPLPHPRSRRTRTHTRTGPERLLAH